MEQNKNEMKTQMERIKNEMKIERMVREFERSENSH